MDPLNPWDISRKKKKTKTQGIAGFFQKKTDAQVRKEQEDEGDCESVFESVDHMLPALELNGRHIQENLEWDFIDSGVSQHHHHHPYRIE